jgi:hypothetical protein
VFFSALCFGSDFFFIIVSVQFDSSESACHCSYIKCDNEKPLALILGNGAMIIMWNLMKKEKKPRRS